MILQAGLQLGGCG